MKRWFCILMAAIPALALPISLARAEDNVDSMQAVAVNVDNGENALLQLDVKQAPLAEVLKTLSAKTATPIHYSVLPEGLITATCAGQALKPVLECLLDHKADVIVRYKQGSEKAAKQNAAIAEAWVLGAKLEAQPSNAACQPMADKGKISLTEKKPGNQVGMPKPLKSDQSGQLLKIVENAKAEDRAQAIGDLLMIGREDDPKVKTMLEKAVNDPDEKVRAQAISTLTHREDYSEHATEIIRKALDDPSVDVRLMAVDGVSGDQAGDEALLQQAMNDADETVRVYASNKLEELYNKQNNQNEAKIISLEDYTHNLKTEKNP